VLDWFHVAIKSTNLQELAKGVMDGGFADMRWLSSIVRLHIGRGNHLSGASQVKKQQMRWNR
jgi:hypothetical protein